jgi:CRISPR-associated protein Cmr1
MTKQPVTITATYRIVTPLFCAGANQQSAELRLPSFKGVLRFWWRSLIWGELLEEAKGNDNAALNALRLREGQLFGSCDAGQAAIRMRLRWLGSPPDDSDLVRDWPQSKPPLGSTYLGYGITESGRRGQPDYKAHRLGLPCERSFEVSLAVRRLPRPVETETLSRALKVLGLIGGVGSRSRRAFGSVVLTQLDGNSISVGAIEEYRNMLTKLTGSLPEALPPYSAFSCFTRIAFLPGNADSFKAHAELGEAYRYFRGQPGPYRGHAKIPLGLPLKDVDDRRRASPIIMQIHPIGSEFVPVVLFMPSRFHPEIPGGNNIEFFELINNWMRELKGFAL